MRKVQARGVWACGRETGPAWSSVGLPSGLTQESVTTGVEDGRLLVGASPYPGPWGPSMLPLSPHVVTPSGVSLQQSSSPSTLSAQTRPLCLHHLLSQPPGGNSPLLFLRIPFVLTASCPPGGGSSPIRAVMPNGGHTGTRFHTWLW